MGMKLLALMALACGLAHAQYTPPSGSSSGGLGSQPCALASGSGTASVSPTFGAGQSCTALSLAASGQTTINVPALTGSGDWTFQITNPTPVTCSTASPCVIWSGVTLTGSCQPDGSSAGAITIIRLSQTPTTGTFLGSGCVSDTASAPTPKTLLQAATTGPAIGIDFPERFMVPAANCNNTSPGAGWSIGSGGTVTCRGGSNNLGGYVTITDTSSTFAQFMLAIPVDWDTTTNPYIGVGLTSGDTTNGHTIIPQIRISCPTAVNGTVSDDHAFATAHSLTTVTVGTSAVANGLYTTSIQMNSTDMTGCVAGGMMIVQVGRATDTATSANFYYADVTFPRLLTVQAN